MAGEPLKHGAAFPKEKVNHRRLRQLYDMRTIVYAGTTPGQRITSEEMAVIEAAEADTADEAALLALEAAESAPAADEPEEAADPADAPLDAADEADAPEGEVQGGELTIEAEGGAEAFEDGETIETDFIEPEEAFEAGPVQEGAGEPVTGTIDEFPERTAVEIPDNWAGLHWQKRRILAGQIIGEAPANAAESDAVIVAELARRGNP